MRNESVMRRLTSSVYNPIPGRLDVALVIMQIAND